MNNTLDIIFEEEIPDAHRYITLFESTGWNTSYKVDTEELYTAISRSWYTLCAYNVEKELVGFGRVVSDSVLYAFICDLIVAPEYQNQGIGSRILNKLIQRCKEGHIRVLWLFSATGKSSFYKKHGFEERPYNAPGMQLPLNIQ